MHPFGLWADPADDERVIGWTRDSRAAVRPWATGAVYLNFIGDEGADRVRAGLGREGNYARLAEVKRAWDPDNVFRHNHNIAPAVGLSPGAGCGQASGAYAAPAASEARLAAVEGGQDPDPVVGHGHGVLPVGGAGAVRWSPRSSRRRAPASRRCRG